MTGADAERDPILEGFLALSTANISDALDRFRLSGAPHGILPLWPGCGKLVGHAMTLKLIPEGPVSPVTGTLEAVMAAHPGDVLVIDHGGRMDVNSWGGIAAFTALRRGVAGVVIDGVTRDVDEMRALGFPAYARGVIQQSVRNRCASAGRGIEVQLAGVPVRPGDVVVADDNGVVVVPLARAEEVLHVASACLEAEERIKEWIAHGVDPLEAHRRVRYDSITSGGGGAP